MPVTNANPNLNAGDLDRRVQLQRPVYNTYQDEITGWETVATVWASIAMETKVEANEAGRTVGMGDVTIVIRWRKDIDARWRVVDRDHTFEVTGLADPARRRTALMLACVEVS